MDATTKCLYASKPCENPRSLKDNGQLHRLCTFHRIKANDAQRRWHSRQKTPASPLSAVAPTTDKLATKKRRRVPRSDTTTDDSSESDVVQLPARRRRRKLATLAVPPTVSAFETALLPPLPTDLTGLLATATAPPPPMYAPTDAFHHTDKLSDAELAHLGDFILELEEIKFHDTLNQDAFEREWWLANTHVSTDASVFCL